MCSCSASYQDPREDTTIYNFETSKDAVPLLLNRATLRLADQDIDGSISDFQKALEAIDYYSSKSPIDTLTQLAFDDSCAPYAGDDYEKSLARLYFALALLQKGDESNAYAILRQSEEFQQRMRSEYAKHPLTKDFLITDDPVAKLLFGLLLEKQGDLSNAKILLEEASALSGNPLPPHSKDAATVVILYHRGNAPIKKSVPAPASQASAIALEFFLAVNRVKPAYCSLPGISVPRLFSKSQTAPSLFDTWYDVKSVAFCELEHKMPVIIARGAARMLLRRSAVAAMDCQDSLLGNALDMGMFFANALTKADTRSWSALPESIEVKILNFEEGIHTVHLGVSAVNVTLKPGDLCVINLFFAPPCPPKILVPSKFLMVE